MQRLAVPLAGLLVSLPAATTHAADGVLVLVEAHVRRGKRDAVLASFRRSQASCPNWDGCRRLEIASSQTDPDRITLVEHWDSVAHHKAEVAKIMARQSFQDFRALLTRDLVFRYLRLL